MEDTAMKFIGAGLAMLGGSLGGGLGLGKLFSAWLEGIARNPSADSKLSKIGFIAFAGTELALLLGFVTALMILSK
jgi:F-type H+-transporting ATPase subunit c